MFRKMRRFKQQLSDSECAELLKSEKRGVLAVFGDDGYPYTVPLDYLYDETNGKIYFHGAKEGHKIDALRREAKCSFCVYGGDYKKDGDWAFMVKSVVVFGKIRFIDSPEKTESLVRKLGLKYYPTAEEVEAVIRQALSRVQMLELVPDYVSGKLVHEK